MQALRGRARPPWPFRLRTPLENSTAALDDYLRLICLLSTSVYSALGVSAIMRYIKRRFTYLLVAMRDYLTWQKMNVWAVWLCAQCPISCETTASTSLLV